jgi:hypothetical protein
MPYTPPQVQRVIDRDYNFNFGEYISEAFNLVTRNFGPILGFMLV